MLSKIKDLGDLCATGVGPQLALDVAQGDMSLGVVGRGKRLLTLELKIGMSHHHQLHVPFNGEQVSHLVIPPAQRLFGYAVETLDFPPHQVVAKDGLRAERQIGADQIAPPCICVYGASRKLATIRCRG